MTTSKMTVLLPHTAYSVSLTLDGRMTSVLGNLYKFKYRAKLLLSYCLKLSQCTVLMCCIFLEYKPRHLPKFVALRLILRSGLICHFFASPLPKVTGQR